MIDTDGLGNIILDFDVSVAHVHAALLDASLRPPVGTKTELSTKYEDSVPGDIVRVGDEDSYYLFTSKGWVGPQHDYKIQHGSRHRRTRSVEEPKDAG